MAIQIKTITRKSPVTKEVAYYANLCTQQPVEKRNLLERLEKRSTMSTADIKGCLDALEYEILQCLLEGRTVRLGDLGSFHLGITTKAADQAKNWKTESHLKRVKIQFIPSGYLRQQIQPYPVGKARFTLVNPKS